MQQSESVAFKLNDTMHYPRSNCAALTRASHLQYLDLSGGGCAHECALRLNKPCLLPEVPGLVSVVLLGTEIKDSLVYADTACIHLDGVLFLEFRHRKCFECNLLCEN